MCGIIGFITEEGETGRTRRADFTVQGAVADTVRGEDSTGAFFVPAGKADDAGWVKNVQSGHTFVRDKTGFVKHFDEARGLSACFVHNRAATVGGVSTKAAHPFNHGRITMIHNGTLTSTLGLPISQVQGGAVNDSETICMNLAQHKFEDFSADLTGAYALVWHDGADGSIHMARNSERPLHIAKVKGQDTIFVGSEALMLDWLVRRNKFLVEMMVQPAPGQHLIFPHGSIVPEIKKFELRHNYGGNHAMWRGSDFSGGTPRPKAGKPSDPQAKESLFTQQVTLGGRLRDVPEASQEALLQEDILVEDRFVFHPKEETLVRTGQQTYLVSGYLLPDGQTATLYGVSAAVVKASIDRDWVVRPLTVKALDRDDVTVICSLLSTAVESNASQEILAEAPNREVLVKGPLEEEDDEIPFGFNQLVTTGETVHTPRGYVSAEIYQTLTQSGCVQCGNNITWADRNHLQWVNEGRDPMCPECIEDMENIAKGVYNG